MANPTFILGINTSHDRSACLVKDGEVIAFIAEERLDRKKHSIEPDANGNFLAKLPVLSIQYCLDAGGIGINDLERIVLSSSVVYHPGEPVRNITMEDVLPQFPDLKDTSRLTILGHHLAHAASAFYPSSFEEAAVMVVDGGGNIVGEKPKGLFTMPPVEHTTLYHGKDDSITELAKVCAEPKSLNSLGALYHMLTIFIGFGQYNEGKTMGLAPYGEDTLVPELEKAVRVHADGTYLIDSTFQPFNWRGEFFKKELMRKLGRPREHGMDLRQHDKDLAFAVQHVLENTLIEMAGKLQKITGSKNLCIAGGVGLNSVANKLILDRTDFEKIFIVPCAADDGCALGCALWGWRQQKNFSKKYVMRHAYLGRQYSDAEIESALREKPDWIKWRKTEDVAKETAGLIASGNIIGWFQGGSEAGPRALGHRSILCDSRKQEMVDTLNAKVKHREGFRPFAPVVPLQYVSDYFEMDCESPYMLLIAKVTQPEVVPAITHVDQTGRVQTVTAEDNGIYYDLVMEFHKLTNVPVLLNTSFNVAGEPIVETPGDALNCFLSTRIDTLVLGDYIVEKKDPELINQLADLQKQVREQSWRIQAMDLELESIRQSKGWQLLTKLNRLRSLLTGRKSDIGIL